MRRFPFYALPNSPYILSRTWYRLKVHDTDSGHLCADEATNQTASIVLRRQTHKLKFSVTQPASRSPI